MSQHIKTTGKHGGSCKFTFCANSMNSKLRCSSDNRKDLNNKYENNNKYIITGGFSNTFFYFVHFVAQDLKEKQNKHKIRAAYSLVIPPLKMPSHGW